MSLEINIIDTSNQSDFKLMADGTYISKKMLSTYQGGYLENNFSNYDSETHTLTTKSVDSDTLNQNLDDSISYIDGVPTRIKDHNDTSKQNIEQKINDASPPTVEPPEQKEDEDRLPPSENGSLLDKMDELNETSLANNLDTNARLDTLNKSIQNMTQILAQNAQYQKSMLSIQAQILDQEKVKNSILGDTLSTIAINMSMLPEISKSLNSSLQSQNAGNFITSTRNLSPVINNNIDFQPTVEALNNQKAELKRSADANESMLNKADTRNSHLKKQGDLANYELTAPITDSQGNETTPVKAKAMHNAEKAEETKNMNNFGTEDDDWDFMDMLDDAFESVSGFAEDVLGVAKEIADDKNPFEELAKIMMEDNINGK